MITDMKWLVTIMFVVTAIIADQARLNGYYTDQAARVMARVIR